MFFKDRTDAGNSLAAIVAKSGDFMGWQVVGLARGGVIVGAQIAKALSLPMSSLYADDSAANGVVCVATGLGSVVIWRKLRRRVVVNNKALRKPGLEELVGRVAEKQLLYNNGAELLVAGKRIILCDDGIVSGRSAISAIDALRFAGAAEIVLAVPVVPSSLPETVNGCRTIFVRRSVTSRFATGMFYYNFADVPDEDVVMSVAA